MPSRSAAISRIARCRDGGPRCGRRVGAGAGPDERSAPAATTWPGFGQGVEQTIHPRLEPGQAGLSRKRIAHAIADDEHRRLECEHVFHQVAEPFRLGAEPRAGGTEDRVAAPPQVAKGDRPVRIHERKECLRHALFLLPLDRAASPIRTSAVAILPRKRKRLGCQGRGQPTRPEVPPGENETSHRGNSHRREHTKPGDSL